MDKLSVNVGDTIYARVREWGTRTRLVKGTVDKVTRSGLIDIKWGKSHLRRFNADGSQRGKSPPYSASEQLLLPTPELDQEYTRATAMREAQAIVNRLQRLTEPDPDRVIEALPHLRGAWKILQEFAK